MENCLVTKLQAVVNNDNLEYFDSFRIIVDNWSNITNNLITLQTPSDFYIGGEGVVVKILSNGNVHDSSTNYGKEYILPSNVTKNIEVRPEDVSKPTDFLLTGLTKIVSVCPTSAIQTNNIHTLSVKKMEYMPNFTPTVFGTQIRLVLLKSSSDSSILTDISIVEHIDSAGQADYFGVPVNGAKGDASVLRGLTGLKNIIFYGNPEISGSLVNDFANKAELTELNLGSTKVSGALEDFAAAQVASPVSRISGTCAIVCSAFITLNGTIVGNNVTKTIKYGSSMVNPTEEETTQGWQIV